MSSALRRSSILLVALFILVTVAPSVAVADETLTWPDDQPVNDTEDPELDSIDVEYNSGDITIIINTTSNGGGDDDLLANNITDVYIDTGDPDGIDDSTFTGGSETATFWDNLEINADYRVAIGDDTNVVEPWDEDTTQFDGTESESFEPSGDNESITVKFSEDDIDSPETIDFQAAFVEGDGFDDSSGYAWTNKGDIILEDDAAVISAEINITDADVDDDAAISVSAGGESEDVDINGNNNLTAELTVDESVDEVTATIEGGTNYTLDKTKDVTGLSEGDEEEVDFEPHRLIDVEGEMINGGDEDYTIELQDSEGDIIVEPQLFDAEGYTFDDINAINATRLDNGTLVANIVDEESLKSVNKTTIDIGDVDRFEPDDPLEIQDLKIEPPTERLEIETNRSVANISKHDTFNVTVNATAEGDDRIDTVKHVVEFDDEQIEHKNTNFVDVDIEDNNGDSVNETLKEEQGDQYKVIIANTSGDPIVSAGSEDVTLFNLTFEFTEEFGDTESDVSPDQGRDNSEDVVIETVDEESRLINSTDSQISTDLEEDDVKDLLFETDSDSVETYNPETVIEENEIDVTHLTTGGDMVGAPVRINIDVGEAATNDGKLDEIILNNTRNDEDPDQDDQSIDCEGDPTCDGTLVHIPQEGQDSLLENSTYATRNIYNITVVPETGDPDTGDNVSINNPRGDGGEEIYKRGDVTLNNTVDDTGNITLAGDIDSVLDKSGTEADGGLPWDSPENSLENAQHDVNNDGEIDVVDVTIVAQEYKPP